MFPARASLKLNPKIWMTIEEQGPTLLELGSTISPKMDHKYYFIINGLTGRIIKSNSINYLELTIYMQFGVFFSKIG